MTDSHQPGPLPGEEPVFRSAPESPHNPPPPNAGLESPVDEPEDAGELELHYERSRIFCFHCNRQESHFHSLKPFQRFPFYVGLTAGLIYLYGPFTCRCCGHQRRFRYDWLHPVLIWRRWFVG